MAFVADHWLALLAVYVAVNGLVWRAFFVCAQGDADRNPVQDFADRDGVAADVRPFHSTAYAEKGPQDHGAR